VKTYLDMIGHSNNNYYGIITKKLFQ